MLAWIFAHTGKLPSEIQALPHGEKAICMMGAIEAMQAEARKPPVFQFAFPKGRK